MQEILQVQFLVNKQLASFEVNKFLGQKFILFLTVAAAAAADAAAAAQPHSEVELAE
jgi:hypothetical protein